MKIVDYIKETRGEMKHVNWPTRKQATMYTIMVVIISVVAALFLGFFDYLFTLGLGKFI